MVTSGVWWLSLIAGMPEGPGVPIVTETILDVEPFVSGIDDARGPRNLGLDELGVMVRCLSSGLIGMKVRSVGYTGIIKQIFSEQEC